MEASLATGIAQELYSFTSRIGGQPAGHPISPDGTYLLEEGGNEVVIWRLEEDGATEAMLLSGHGPGLDLESDFYPDGRRLVTGGSDGIRVWDISSTGEREALTLDAHGDGRIRLALNRDGSQLATASWDGTARLWNAWSGERLREFNGHQDRLQDVDFSPDGNRLVTASDDRTARVWDIVTGEELAVLEASDEGYDVGGVFIGVMSARFSPDGRQIVTGGADGTVRLWDAQTYEPLQSVVINPGGGEDEHPRGVTLAIFSPDGSTLAAATDSDMDDGMFKVWDIETGAVMLEQVLGPRLFGLDFSPDGRRLAVSSCCVGLVQVWDVVTGEQLLSMPPQGGTVGEVFFSADGSRLITNAISFWDATSGELLQTFSGGRSFALSPDESRLFVGTNDGLVRVFLMDIDELVALAQSRLTRSLSEAECQQYLHLDECPPE